MPSKTVLVMLAVSLVVIVAAGGFFASAFLKDSQSLANIHKKIEQEFPAVKHISDGELNAMDEDSRVVFDVREPEEFSVSHLRGAVRISPDISAEDFTRIHGDNLDGKHLVFYCSVGYRSSRLVQRVSQQAKLAGAESALNLEGGIFAWHNTGATIFAEHSPTRAIHPYNAFWGKLIKDSKQIAYASKAKPPTND